MTVALVTYVITRWWCGVLVYGALMSPHPGFVFSAVEDDAFDSE